MRRPALPSVSARTWRRLVAAVVVGSCGFGLGWASRRTAAAAPRIIRSVPLPQKAVALTFDDGPNPQTTPDILKLLADNQAHATFFVLGRSALGYPQLVREEAAAGNEVANHGDQHLVVRGKPAAAIRADVRANENRITELTGIRPVLYRPPEGVLDGAGSQVISQMGYTIVLWNIETQDYLRRISAQVIASRILSQVRPGSIVLMHDGGSGSQRTVNALKTVLPRLRAEGFQLVTVSALLAMADSQG